MPDSQLDNPRVVESPGPESIVAVAAHPDDIERWRTGTLARAIDAGATVRLLLATSGEAGSSSPNAAGKSIAAQRERETRSAADRLGIAEVAFLGESDGAVENTTSLRRALVR
jgi:LmbE family N-acetylglucosaminyl deacetylase